MASTKFQPTAADAAVVAIASVIAGNESLLKSAENFNLSDRSLQNNDTIILSAGLPVCKTGEIDKKTCQWLAFPATIVRGGRNISTTIALNSLVRGYYATKQEDVLSASSKGTMYPSRDLLRRFGDVLIDSITTGSGTQVPFLSDDRTLKIVSVKGYRPVYANGTWSAGNEEELFVVQ